MNPRDIALIVMWVFIAANIACGALSLHSARRMEKMRKRLVLTKEVLDSYLENTGLLLSCIEGGHEWTVDSHELSDTSEHRVTLLVKAECARCHSRLDFTARFGVQTLRPGVVRPWFDVDKGIGHDDSET